jgi:diphosphomevalonate decarboxylase
MKPRLSATAVAHSNIALIKYWGKLPTKGNYPAVPSLSLTLDALCTRTQVTFDSTLKQDEFELDGDQRLDHSLQRVSNLLDTIRAKADLKHFAKVISSNNFPTASGLASSASGFAALALAATQAAGLKLEPAAVSSIARACSASSARSMFGGWVSLDAGADSAIAMDSGQDWQVVLIVAITDPGPKALGSTQAMMRCSATSPYYSTWVETAPVLFASARDALHQRDLDSLGQCMEQSTWRMHATMLTAVPAVVYISPTTLAIINEIRNRRSSTVPAYFTTDAGPHVKVLTLAEHAATVRDWLTRLPGVTDVIICKPGPAAYIEAVSEEGYTS